jgi:putative DNA primase/helicase
MEDTATSVVTWNPTTAAMDRFALLDWLLPACEAETAALFYPKTALVLSPGWVHTAADVERAVAAYRDERLPAETFESVTQNGKPYTIRGAQRLGLVPHRNGNVSIFCVDLDDHAGDGGNVHLQSPISIFLGAEPICITSKSGRGRHLFFQLHSPMPIDAFVRWGKAWGFNRTGQPELFPKTAKRTQLWLPNAPNERGGDRHIGGTVDSCLVEQLPPAPKVKLASSTLEFFRGCVPAGDRNNRLNKAAFELGAKRVSELEAHRLCRFGARLCGLDVDDAAAVDSTFESGYRAGQGAGALSGNKPTKLFTLDGIGNGERFTSRYGRRTRYCYELKQWLIWTGSRWSLSAQHWIQRWAKRAAKRIKQETRFAVRQAETEGRAEESRQLQTAYQRHQRFTSSQRGVQEMLAMAQSEPGIQAPLDSFDRDPWLLNVGNGTVNLRDGQLRPYRRGDGITKQSRVSFLSDAPSPRWDAFVERIFAGDRELIDFVRRAVGYSLTGLVSEQCLFFLYGGGSNGKSVFVQTLLHICGEYGQKAPTEMLMKQERSSGSASPELARLRGVRFAVTAELEEGKQFGEARVKDLTGADRIVARPLFCDPVEFEPTHKLWMYGNHKPTIRGTDDGIWRRIRLIPFQVTIPEHERDPQLMAKLQDEAEGILAWAVRGCLEWQQVGLSAPAVVTGATDAYRRDSDRLREFIGECCVVTEHARVAKADFYVAYEKWAHAGGERPWSKKKVGEALTGQGYQDGRGTGGTRYWEGLGLVTSDMSDT